MLRPLYKSSPLFKCTLPSPRSLVSGVTRRNSCCHRVLRVHRTCNANTPGSSADPSIALCVHVPVRVRPCLPPGTAERQLGTSQHPKLPFLPFFPSVSVRTTISENLCKRQRFFAGEELKRFPFRLLCPPLAGGPQRRSRASSSAKRTGGTLWPQVLVAAMPR